MAKERIEKMIGRSDKKYQDWQVQALALMQKMRISGVEKDFNTILRFLTDFDGVKYYVNHMSPITFRNFCLGFRTKIFSEGDVLFERDGEEGVFHFNKTCFMILGEVVVMTRSKNEKNGIKKMKIFKMDEEFSLPNIRKKLKINFFDEIFEIKIANSENIFLMLNTSTSNLMFPQDAPEFLMKYNYVKQFDYFKGLKDIEFYQIANSLVYKQKPIKSMLYKKGKPFKLIRTQGMQ